MVRIIKSTLDIPFVYNFFEKIIGGNKGYEFFVKDFMNVGSNAKVLDIGCGTANLRKYFPETTDYFGYDTNPDYIDFAKKNLKGSFFCEDTDAFRKRIGELKDFDVVFAYGVIHHLPDSEMKKVMDLAKACLKTSGHFYTCDPCFHQDQSIFAKWTVSNDRGKFVRSHQEYIKLLGNEFRLDYKIRNDAINIPTTLFYSKCSLEGVN